MNRVVRWMVRLFPRSFRERYGDEVSALLAERAEATRRRRGPWAAVPMLLYDLFDLARAAVAERRSHRRRGGVMAAVRYDMGNAVRGYLKQPGFTLVAGFTLAVGLGANTALFTVVNGVLLQPLPYPEADRLVVLWHRSPGGSGRYPLTPTAYLTYRDNQQAFEQVGAWSPGDVTVIGDNEPERVGAIRMTPEVMDLLRTPPRLGRGFVADDVGASATPVVVLTDGWWQRRFGADPNVIGRTVRIDGEEREIVGVMPPSFRFLQHEPAVVLPLGFSDRTPSILSFDYDGIGRLRAGATLEDAQRDVNRMIPLATAQFPPEIRNRLNEIALSANVQPLENAVVGDVGRVLWVLLGAVSLILVIACANVANLSLVRAESRQREMAVRTALGAAPGRIVALLVSEAVVLAAAAGTAGLALAYAGIRLLTAIAPENLPRQPEIGIDLAVVGFVMAISLLAGLLSSVGPALRYGHPPPDVALRESSRGSTGTRHGNRARTALAITEIALALVLSVGAGLMVRTFLALRAVPPGFSDPASVVTFRLDIPPADGDAVIATHRQLASALAAVPGVVSVGAASGLTMEGRSNNNVLYVEGATTTEASPPAARYKAIAGDYFETMGIPLLAGRALTWDDAQQRRPVGVVTENIAREFWGDPANAIGRRIKHRPEDPWREIVGVVADVHDVGLARDAPRVVYWPVAVADFLGFPEWVRRSMAYVVRTADDAPLGRMSQLRAAVWSVQSDLPVVNARTLDALVAGTMAETSFALVMLAIAAGVAVLLGTVGVAGVVAYIAAQRRGEIGLRLALGATSSDVRRLVVGHGVGLAGVGVGAGVVIAMGVSRLMASLLFGVSGVDGLTFVVAAGLVGAATLGAALWPARGMGGVEAGEVLRM